MLDILLFREERGNDPERIRESQRRRFASVELVDEVIKLDKEWRQRQYEVDNIRKEVNKVQDGIKKKKMAKEDTAELLVEKSKLEEAKIAKEKETAECKVAMEASLRLVGNLVHDSVPIDNNEDNNLVVRTWGTPRDQSGLVNHVDLVNKLGIVDLEAGTDVAGGRGYFLKQYGVMLNQALINFGLAFLLKRGYTLLQTPFFMRQEVMAECAQLAQFDEELYKVTGEGDDKYLIATAEQPLCSFHRGSWMDPKALPIKYAGYSTCFRKEAGSHGRDTLGIFRVHQFEKVEQFCITSPNDNDSWEVHEEMLKNSEEFYQQLGLPYRVVSIVSGALNDSAAKKYDLEAWFPASKTYRELVSCSNCTDYQSRNLEIRYGQKKMNDQVKNYCHLLNSTLTATERTLCCILENYQTPDGVRVPEVLQPFMLNTEFLPFTEQSKDKKDAKKDAKAKNPPAKGSAVGAQEKKVSSDNGVGTPDIHQLKL
ncbi:serine--tRNA ligase isoform X2 [Physcomitrium patens]|uniref:serine--tRNA ligase n=2 Tax=Physcomitrium patens TaxID=3218 RepID=A0A7I4FNU8_PHYPA|nr:serine--tRNA ligase-like isoform X2 [Physcomitrium patens]|eukprot:XP_024373250.1 serine--tRNA ligase-like isoform X2 [Physcomitrella patens]